jgi:glycosyltransferase 2 family protein
LESTVRTGNPTHCPGLDQKQRGTAIKVSKNNLIAVAGCSLSLLLLYLSLRGIQFQEIIASLKKADYRFVFLPLLFIFFSVSLSAFKWSRIAGSGVRLGQTFVGLIVGLFVNNVLPVRIGEVARSYVLSRKAGLSLTYSLSTVIVDRFFDLLGLLLITFLFLPRHALPLRVSQAIYTLVGMALACIILMIILSREDFANILAKLLARLKRPFFLKLTNRISEIQENLRRINSPLNIFSLTLISFVQWLSMSAALYFVVLTLHVSVQLVHIPFVCALLNMGLTIPSSPGYVGVYQFLLVYLLSIFGVPKHEGFAVSILFHASWYIPYNVLGFVFVMKEHLKIREIRRLEKNR